MILIDALKLTRSDDGLGSSSSTPVVEVEAGGMRLWKQLHPPYESCWCLTSTDRGRVSEEAFDDEAEDARAVEGVIALILQRAAEGDGVLRIRTPDRHYVVPRHLWPSFQITVTTE